VVDHVARSIEALRRRPDRTSTTSQRTAYCMIISPADSAGIDLKRLTRVAMSQLEQDSGAKLPPWIAGEHRNTAHPHVHVVLAAKRETRPGEYRTLVITRERLQRMKVALHEELARQRGVRLRVRGTALRAGEAATLSPLHPLRSSPSDAQSHARVEPPRKEEILAFSRAATRRYLPYIERHPTARVAVMAGRLARHYRRDHDREQRWTR
jgi:hypothetical protein